MSEKSAKSIVLGEFLESYVKNMSLPFNLLGAIREVNTSKSNKELIESLNRLTEEFYRTRGILFYVRYNNLVNANKIGPNQDMLQLVQNYMKSPTFDSWMRLGLIAGGELFSSGDEFAKKCAECAERELEGDTRNLARSVHAEIQKLKSNADMKPPKRIRTIETLEIMRTLRNFRSHEWDNNVMLQPLVDSGIKQLVLQVVNSFFEDMEIEVLKPHSIKKDHVETYSLRCGKVTIDHLARPETPPVLEASYVRYFPGEYAYDFPTNLIFLDENEGRVFVYQETKDNGEQMLLSVPEIGHMKKVARGRDDIETLFDLHAGVSSLLDQSQTLTQKFGAISETDGVMHNLPALTDNYVGRPSVENQLIQKLAHKRLYITTLDGGGGFGKTELAKKVIWDLINGRDPSGAALLRLRLVIWTTGKITYFKGGTIIETQKTFDTLEDLLDCILYLTNNLQCAGKLIEEKKQIVMTILDRSEDAGTTLIVLDNLETTSQKDEIWEYLIQLGHHVESNIKILITSRTLGAHGDQRLNVRSMEQEEARQLVLREMETHDVNKAYRQEDAVHSIVEMSGRIPLLIKYFVNLISRGFNINELKKNMPKEAENAFNFMCSFQWDELSDNAKKLLMAIAKGSGKISFAQAKLLCNLSNDEFQGAKEELQNRSFLLDSELINSMLAILPPIGKFVTDKMAEYPDIEDELNENMKLIEVPSTMKLDPGIQSILYSDEIALNQIFQRADIMIRRGAIEDAQRWYKQAVDRFPESHVAWRVQGEFQFKHLDDYEGAKKCFEKAIALRPEDPANYRQYARCEHERGANLNLKINLKKSIELNQKALELTPDTNIKRMTTDFMASSLMKLGYIHRDEAIRNANPSSRRMIFDMAHGYFDQAIKLLTGHLIKNPVHLDEKKHNSVGCSMLANAYLSKGGQYDYSRRSYDLNALKYLIDGFKLDFPNSQLIYQLGHPGMMKLLNNYGIPYENTDIGRRMVIPDVIRIESKVLAELNGKKT